jgi:HEAT repeat protein
MVEVGAAVECYQISRFDQLERPVAAATTIEHLKPASEEERRHMLDELREVGAIEVIVRSTKQVMPWRRALAVRTLGWIGAKEAVPVLIDRLSLSDRSRYVRESAVRALGRIADATALPELDSLFRSPGRVGAGVIYDALIALGPQAESVFIQGLRSRPQRSLRCSSAGRTRDSVSFGRRTAAVPTRSTPG